MTLLNKIKKSGKRNGWFITILGLILIIIGSIMLLIGLFSLIININKISFNQIKTLLIFLFIYFLPTIMSYINKHPKRRSILFINGITGITGLGWIISLVWSFIDFDELIDQRIKKNLLLNKKRETLPSTLENKINSIEKILNKTEFRILKIIFFELKNKESIWPSKLLKKINEKNKEYIENQISKATINRTINSLVKKEILQTSSEGKLKKIFFNKKFLDT